MQNIDLSGYKYTALSHMRNLYAGVDVTRAAPDIAAIAADPLSVKVQPDIIHLAKQLQLSRPRWTFFVFPQYLSATQARLFIFQDNDEYLGWVSYSDYSERYEYDCRILNVKRSRGACNHTTKLDKVRSDVLKHFVPKNMAEKFATLYSKTTASSGTIYSEKISSYERRLNGLMSSYHATILERWDDIKHILGAEQDSTEAAALVAQTETYKQSRIDYEMTGRGDFMTIIVSGNTWHTKKGSQEQDFAHENVPEHIRTAVGMLKLVENGQHVPGFGVRIAPNQFSIFTQE